MRTVLVVEDDFANRNLVALLMRRGGWSVEVASDAGEAWEKLHNGAPDLVVTDIGLPGKSGVQLLSEIRAEWPRQAVVALTADLSSENELRGAGFDDVWDKPFDEEKLERASALVTT